MAAVTRAARGEASSRRIHGQGTFESTWQAWAGLAKLPAVSLDVLAPGGGRVVVVAPHPDDEVLGCGGTLASLLRAGHEVLVVAVTDGEASHPGSLHWTPARLASTRRAERDKALRRLGVQSRSVGLGLPDGGLTDRRETLTSALRDILRPSDVVFTTWRHDGHPDHEAVGDVVAEVTDATGAALREMPIWMWHWAAPGDARVPWNTLTCLALDDHLRHLKRLAVGAHGSQIRPDGARPAVLPVWALTRLLRPFEYFFLTPERS